MSAIVFDNIATREVAEVAMHECGGTYTEAINYNQEAKFIKTYLMREATSWAKQEIQFDPQSDDGELMPSWCCLLLTPNIHKTINWNQVARHVVEYCTSLDYKLSSTVSSSSVSASSLSTPLL